MLHELVDMELELEWKGLYGLNIETAFAMVPMVSIPIPLFLGSKLSASIDDVGGKETTMNPKKDTSNKEDPAQAKVAQIAEKFTYDVETIKKFITLVFDEIEDDENIVLAKCAPGRGPGYPVPIKEFYKA